MLDLPELFAPHRIVSGLISIGDSAGIDLYPLTPIEEIPRSTTEFESLDTQYTSPEASQVCAVAVTTIKARTAKRHIRVFCASRPRVNFILNLEGIVE